MITFKNVEEFKDHLRQTLIKKGLVYALSSLDLALHYRGIRPHTHKQLTAWLLSVKESKHELIGKTNFVNSFKCFSCLHTFNLKRTVETPTCIYCGGK